MRTIAGASLLALAGAAPDEALLVVCFADAAVSTRRLLAPRREAGRAAGEASSSRSSGPTYARRKAHLKILLGPLRECQRQHNRGGRNVSRQTGR